MCVSIHLAIQTHISVTAGMNLILGMMMGYGLGMIPIFFLYGLLSQMQSKMSVSEIGSNDKHIQQVANSFRVFSPMFPITLDWC